MIMLKKVLCLMLIVGMLFVAAGCDNSGGADEDRGEVVGSVNGVDLYQAEFDTYFSDYYLSYLQNYADYFKLYMGIDLLDEESAHDTLAELESYAWDMMVQSELILQLAENDYGITYTSDFLEGLLPWGSYRSICVQNVYSQLAQTVYDELLAAITVDDAQVQAAYEADPAKWNSRSSSHILIAFDTEDETAKAEAFAKAQGLIEELNNGADFATLAKENSDDGSAENGGQINAYIRADGYAVDESTSFYTEYVDALYALGAVGDYTLEPVLSSAGYHIIKLDDVRDSLEASKDVVAESLKTVADEDVSAAVSEKLSALRESAEIVQDIDFRYYEPAAEEATATDENAEETTDESTDENTDDSTDGNTDDSADDGSSADDEAAEE